MESNNFKKSQGVSKKIFFMQNVIAFFQKRKTFLLSQEELNKKYFFNLTYQKKQCAYIDQFFIKNVFLNNFFENDIKEELVSSCFSDEISSAFSLYDEDQEKTSCQESFELISWYNSGDFPCLCGDCEKCLSEDESISEYINYKNQDLDLTSKFSEEYLVEEIYPIKENLINPEREIDYCDLLKEKKPFVNLFKTFREEFENQK